MTEFSAITEKTVLDGTELVLGASSGDEAVPQKYSLPAINAFNGYVDLSAGGDQTTNINTALVAARDAGGGAVYLRGAGTDITTTAPLLIYAKCQLNLEPGTRINNTANTDVVQLMDWSASVVGGELHNSNAGFTASVILIDTATIVTNMRKGVFCGARNISLSATDGISVGTGINMVADGSDPDRTAIQYTTWDNVKVFDLHTGINMQVAESGVEVAFINSNVFTNLLMEDCVYFIRGTISGDNTPVINANSFVNVSMQTDTDSEKAIYFTGGDFSRNTWTNLTVWDWGVANSPIAIDIPGENTFTSLQGIKPEDMLITGGAASFVGSRNIPLSVPTLNSGTEFPDPTQYIGAIVFFTDLGKLAWCNGVNWREISILTGSLP